MDHSSDRLLEWTSDPDRQLVRRVDWEGLERAGTPSKTPASCTSSGQPALPTSALPAVPEPARERSDARNPSPPTNEVGRELHQHRAPAAAFTGRRPDHAFLAWFTARPRRRAPVCCYGPSAARGVSCKIRCRRSSISVSRGSSAPAQSQTSDARSRTQ
jgi:hypothetical protein